MKCKNCRCEIVNTTGIGFLHKGYFHKDIHGPVNPCPCGCNNPQPYPSWLDKNMEKIIDTCLKAGMIFYGLLAFCCAVLAQMVIDTDLTSGAIIALNGCFYLLMFFLMMDNRHDIKIEKRLKALEEGETEMIAEVELFFSLVLILTLITIVVMLGATICNQVNEEAKKCPECNWTLDGMVIL